MVNVGPALKLDSVLMRHVRFIWWTSSNARGPWRVQCRAPNLQLMNSNGHQLCAPSYFQLGSFMFGLVMLQCLYLLVERTEGGNYSGSNLELWKCQCHWLNSWSYYGNVLCVCFINYFFKQLEEIPEMHSNNASRNFLQKHFNTLHWTIPATSDHQLPNRDIHPGLRHLPPPVVTSLVP